MIGDTLFSLFFGSVLTPDSFSRLGPFHLPGCDLISKILFYLISNGRGLHRKPRISRFFGAGNGKRKSLGEIGRGANSILNRSGSL